MIGLTMQQRVDPRHRYLLVACQFGSTAFQGRQLDIGLKHVLLRRLVHLVLVPGDLSELRQEAAGRGVHVHLPPSQVIVVECRSRRFGQPQPDIADVALHRVGLGRGRAAAQGPLARPRNLLRGFHHPAAAIVHAEAVGG